jgi:hypothetical protein
MWIVSVKLPQLMSTVPLLCTAVMMKGPLVGLLRDTYCLGTREVFSLALEADADFWRSVWIVDQLTCTAQRKIMSWLKAR